MPGQAQKSETESELDLQMVYRCAVDSGEYLLTSENVPVSVGVVDPSYISLEGVYVRSE